MVTSLIFDSIDKLHTWYILWILGQFLAAHEDGEGVPAIIGFMNLPDLYRVIREKVVKNLWERGGMHGNNDPQITGTPSRMGLSPQTCCLCHPTHSRSVELSCPSLGTASACRKWMEWCRHIVGSTERASMGLGLCSRPLVDQFLHSVDNPVTIGRLIALITILGMHLA